MKTVPPKNLGKLPAQLEVSEKMYFIVINSVFVDVNVMPTQREKGSPYNCQIIPDQIDGITLTQLY